MLIRNRVWQCSANYVLANSPVHLADLPTPFTFSHSYTCKPWRQPPIRRSDLFSTKMWTDSPTYRLTCQYRSTCNWRKEKLFFKRHCLILITWGVRVVGSNLVLQARWFWVVEELWKYWKYGKKCTCHHLSVIMHCQTCQATMLVLPNIHLEKKQHLFFSFSFFYSFL